MDFLNLGNGLLSKGNSTTYGQIYLLTFSGDKSYYSINYTEEEKEKINFERSILGLSTIEEYQIKQIFQAENGLRENRFLLVPVTYDSYPIEFKEEMALKKLVDKNWKNYQVSMKIANPKKLSKSSSHIAPQSPHSGTFSTDFL